MTTATSTGPARHRPAIDDEQAPLYQHACPGGGSHVQGFFTPPAGGGQDCQNCREPGRWTPLYVLTEPVPVPSVAAVARLRAALDAVGWARNSGDGSTPAGDVDELLDAARDLLSPPHCQTCGSTAGPVRPTSAPDPRVPQLVCVDAAACLRRCADMDPERGALGAE
jgi:hypothetical protein